MLNGMIIILLLLIVEINALIEQKALLPILESFSQPDENCLILTLSQKKHLHLPNYSSMVYSLDDVNLLEDMIIDNYCSILIIYGNESYNFNYTQCKYFI